MTQLVISSAYRQVQSERDQVLEALGGDFGLEQPYNLRNLPER